MRVNVFSPLTYSWENFAALQHEYAALRRRRDVRHADYLAENRKKEAIDDGNSKKENISDIVLRGLFFKKLLHKIAVNNELILELNRIKYEREFLENMRIVSAEISISETNKKYLNKVSLNEYIQEMKTIQHLVIEKDVIDKNIVESAQVKKQEKLDV